MSDLPEPEGVFRIPGWSLPTAGNGNWRPKNSVAMSLLINVDPWTKALASPGSLIEMQALRPDPDSLNQNLHDKKMPR